MTYGIHLTLRIANITNTKSLNDKNIIQDFLETLVHEIGMRILAGPLVGQELGGPENSGCSGVVILFESHAAIHTYNKLGEAFIDIFSCKKFKIPTVLAVLQQYFGGFGILEKTSKTEATIGGLMLKKN